MHRDDRALCDPSLFIRGPPTMLGPHFWGAHFCRDAKADIDIDAALPGDPVDCSREIAISRQGRGH
jgi:hypothetical protein